MNPKELFESYLKNNKAMQLATVENGQPWICTVYFVSDASNNIYWTSARSRRHSKEIIADSKVATTIVQDSQKKQAAQITGVALEVPLSDVERVNKLYAEKFGDKPSRLAEVLANKPEGRAYWMLTPKTVELWDEVNFPDAPKQKVNL